MFDKDQSLQQIATYSGNLAGKLSRLDLRLNTTDLAQAFEYSIKNGGLDELEFKRPDGQSYNPRPARIALILIESSAEITTQNLIACFFSCCRKQKKDHLPFKEAIEISNKSLLFLKSLKENEEYRKQSKDIILLAMSLHLDHARHLHLGELVKNTLENKAFCHVTEKLIIEAKEINTYFYQTMQHWLRRHKSKYNL